MNASLVVYIVNATHKLLPFVSKKNISENTQRIFFPCIWLHLFAAGKIHLSVGAFCISQVNLPSFESKSFFVLYICSQGLPLNFGPPPWVFNGLESTTLKLRDALGIESSHLSMKEGSLFCSYEIHRTGMLQIMFLVSLENSWWGGVHGIGYMTFGLAVQKFLNIEWFLHWKLWGNPILRYIVGGSIVATNDDGDEYRKLVVLDHILNVNLQGGLCTWYLFQWSSGHCVCVCAMGFHTLQL